MHIWTIVCIAALSACSFDNSGRPGNNGNIDASMVDADNTPDAMPDAMPPDACTDPVACQGWWVDGIDYLLRQPLTVTVGPTLPMNGYVDYTVRLTNLDTAALVTAGELRSDCNDLRIVRQVNMADPGTELVRHVLGCNTATTEVRFSLPVDIVAGGSDDLYYMYYNNAAATAPTAVDTTNVYLWYDDASADRMADYTHGRIDPLAGFIEGWDDSAAHDGAGYYTYDTGNDKISGYRRPVAERDVYVEAEFMHTDCQPLQMYSGLIVRGVIAGGTDDTETADHFYASSRAHNAACGNASTQDGDILKTSLFGTDVAVAGAAKTTVLVNTWRKQGLAAWGTNPSNLAFWDNDTPWVSLGWPGNTDLQTSGTDGAADDYEGTGFAGIWTSQDAGRFRNLIIRRYVEPEPSVTGGVVEPRI